MVESDRATVALGVDAVEREVLVVAATRGGLQALQRRSVVAQPAVWPGAISMRSISRSVGAPCQTDDPASCSARFLGVSLSPSTSTTT